jgi:NAD+ synthase
MKIKKAYFPNGIKKSADELAEQVIQFTKGTGASGGVIGLSGGVDSTTVAYLCKYAFDKFPEDNLKLYGVLMPSKANAKEDEQDGIKVAKALDIEYSILPIEGIAEKFSEQIEGLEDEFHKGNLYSEIRAVMLSRVAAVKNCRVMGTGNRDEDYVLGYFTKRGDGAVDNNILGNLPKRLVRELATYLGVPEDLVKRVPTAGLWADQTDEGELGYTYDQAELIQNGFDQGMSIEKIEEETSFKKNIIEDVARRHRTTEHKRNAPPVGKINLEFRED